MNEKIDYWIELLVKAGFIAILSAVLFVSGSVFAQTPALERTGLRLTLSPAFMNLTTDPGVPVSSQLKITNNGSAVEDITITLQKFKSGNNGETPELSDFEKTDDFANWISFREKSFSIQPSATKTLPFTIKPSKEAALGYYYAVVIGRTKKDGVVPGGASIDGSPAIPVLLEVRSKSARREIQIVDFNTSSLVYEYFPVNFTITLKNSGNIHAVPVGDIFIDQGSQKNLAIIRANPGKGNILPNSTRTYTASWDDGFFVRKPKVENGIIVRDGNGKEVLETTWDWSKADRFRIGKYTAHVLMIYDNGVRDIPMEAIVSFWVIPWKIIGVALLLLVFVGFGLWAVITTIIRAVKNISKK